jgi:hypothetical protein
MTNTSIQNQSALAGSNSRFRLSSAHERHATLPNGDWKYGKCKPRDSTKAVACFRGRVRQASVSVEVIAPVQPSPRR